MIGTSLGHYDILEELGSGGMGTVYLAEDRRLGRRVALKVLPPETAADPERRARFEREARVVASLNHPNVVTLHSVETEGDVLYLTMELVAGQPLSGLIPTGGMGLPELFSAALPLVAAIQAAHRQGVAHRDLKPDNIMVDEEGRLKVLDFGLAQLVQTGFQDQAATLAVGHLTAEGQIMGTVAYMSPEQAEAKETDHRTDIFSLGVILYEMCTGRRPFQGDSAISTLTAVLRDTPPPVNSVREDLPEHLARLIARCLAKEPDRRYQTAQDVANELDMVREELHLHPATTTGTSLHVATPAVPGARPGKRRVLPFALGLVTVVSLALVGWFVLGPGREAAAPGATGSRATSTAGSATQEIDDRSIVVLPFENLGPPEDLYFAAGITDEIMSRLASVRDLSVISRTTAVQYDKTHKTLPQIGADLGVTHVLEGSVRWEKHADGTSEVRVVSRLVRAADDSQVWSGRHQRTMQEVFRIQSEIAEEVVEALDIRLQSENKSSFAAHPTENVEAYHAYLRASEYLAAGAVDRASEELAMSLLERAIKLDPEYLPALAKLVESHAAFVHFEYDASPERLAVCDSLVTRMREVDPESPWVEYAAGYLAYRGRKDYTVALHHFERARAGMPGNTRVREAMGFVERRRGRFQAAMEHFGAALERDPRNTRLLYSASETLGVLGRYEEAQALNDLLISLLPDQDNGYAMAALHLAYAGRYGEARQALAELPPEVTGGFSNSVKVRLALLSGDAATVDARTRDQRTPIVGQFRYLHHPFIAGRAHALVGDPAEARRLMQEARPELEALYREQEDHSTLLSAMGTVLAVLGEPEEAIRLGERSIETAPASKDAWIRNIRRQDLSFIYLIAGRLEEAIAIWEELVNTPGTEYVTPGALRESPIYDPAREHLRFQQILERQS